MKPIPPIQEPTEEEKAKFISICNQGEFIMESEETKQNLTLVDKEEVSPTAEVLDEIGQSLEAYKGVVYDKILEILPSMKDHQHHGTFILHNFEDTFIQKESA